MNLENFLTNEAISTYITFFLGILLTTSAFFVQKTFFSSQPKIINLLRVSQQSELDINLKTDDLEVKYKSMPIKKLYRTNFILYNAGDETADNILFRLTFSNVNAVIDVIIDDPLKRAYGLEAQYQPDFSSAKYEFKIPFINSMKLHKDYIVIKVFSNELIDLKEYEGGGREWSINYFDYRKEIDDILLKLTGNPLRAFFSALLNIRQVIKLLRLVRISNLASVSDSPKTDPLT